MKKQLYLLSALLVLCQLLYGQNKVLIIGIDGCRSDALQQANTPNIDQFLNNAIYSWDALNDGITISGPGWSSMLTGVWHEKHGVTNNNFSGSNYEEYPHFFRRVEAYDSSLHTASICQWGPINDFIVADEADFKLNVNSGEQVAIQASNYLINNDPDALFLHFDDVDHAGHSYGFSPEIPQYIQAIEEVDVLIGLVRAGLNSRPTLGEENWLILLSTDHGGLGTSHGGNSIQEQNIFVIASGITDVPNEIAKDSSEIDIPAPENCLGNEVELQFDGENDNVIIPNDGTFDFGTDRDFTIECRVRTTVPADVSIIGNKDWDSGFNKGFVFSYKYPAGPEWKVNIGDGSNRADINTGGEIADGAWHTLSVSFDRDGLMKLYQDGTLYDSTDISFIGDIDNDFDLFFGTDVNTAYDFNGSMEEVRIWDKVLEAGEISTWACTGLTDSHPDYDQLLGHWKLNEGTGQSVTDYGPDSHDGSVNEALWVEPGGVEWVYNYSNTPRIVDIAVTAMQHLCIEVDPVAWDLDGNSLIADNCIIIDATEEVISNSSLVQVFPNPVSDYLQINILDSGFEINQIEIYDVDGALKKKRSQSDLSFKLNVRELSNGIYLMKVKGEGKTYVSRFVKQ